MVGVTACVTVPHNNLTTNCRVESGAAHKVPPAPCLPGLCREMQNWDLALTFSLIFTGISIPSPALGGGICLQSSWFLLQLSFRKKPNVWREVWRCFINVFSVYISSLLHCWFSMLSLHDYTTTCQPILLSYNHTKFLKRLNKRKRFYGSSRTGVQKRNNWLYFY